MSSVQLTLTPRETAEALKHLIPARLPVLIVSAPGIGKTSVVRQVTESLGYDLVIMHPSISEPTDFKGLPCNIDGNAHFLPYGQLREIIDATEPTVCFIDDLGQAPPSVQAAIMQPLHDRRIDGHRVSESVVFVAATNRREDRAGVGGLLEPVKSRFASIIHMAHSVDDWCDFMQAKGYPAIETAFIRFRSDLLSQFVPSADMTNSPSPRGWEAVAKIGQTGLTGKLRTAAIHGAVGPAAGMERVAFDQVYGELPDLRDILLNPGKAKVYDEPGILWALIAALSGNADKANIADTFTYLLRCPKEFMMFAMKSIHRRDANVIPACPKALEWISDEKNFKLFLPQQG